MKVTFATDYSVTRAGFKLRFERHQCGGRINEETEIHSPVHPDRYFHNTNCSWVITAPEGKVVEMK